MDTVLIVSETLGDFDRMKAWFMQRKCRVKGSHSLAAAEKLLDVEKIELIALCSRGDFGALFSFYEKLRTSEKNVDTPLVILADHASQAVLANNVRLTGTRTVGITVTDDNMHRILDETMGKIR